MGFIRNFEIWNNQRPRVCNFDILDYCGEGIIGNTCTENTTSIDAIDWGNQAYLTSNATQDAWQKAVNEYALALFSFYYQNGTDDPPSGGHPAIPAQYNFKCITVENYGKLLDLYYGDDGFIGKFKEFYSAKLLWWNCILNPIYKQTGIVSYPILLPVAPMQPSQTYIITVDYTNYQTATKTGYLEYRKALDAMLAALKIFMQSSGKQPLTHYDIVPQPCPDLNIGDQVWKRCNLSVTKYRNGDTIPQVTDPTAWANLTTGAWCYYDNDPTTEPLYGRLYNWYAVNDPRGLAPTGYHVATDDEWTTLTNYVSDDTTAGGILKQVGYIGGLGNCVEWAAPNTGAMNQRGFTALPAGYRNITGSFSSIGDIGFWWTSAQDDIDISWYRKMTYDSASVVRQTANQKSGFSVRIIKN